MSKKMHLGWFMNYAPAQWMDPFDRVDTSWTNADFHIEMATMLEGACFDYLMIEEMRRCWPLRSSKPPRSSG